MSEKYDAYLKEHIANVRKGLLWLYKHDDIPVAYSQLTRLFDQHDLSKFYNEEYDAYDDYFYGKEGLTDKEAIQSIDEAFDYAWLHHIHNNKHHWQYWVLLEDEGKTKALEMPIEYVYEMIADWWSFSWKKGNLKEIFEWYDSHKNKMVLHQNTRKLVEDILEKIKTALEEDDASAS